ncbi:MAG: diguanylate cyclase, partial [Candidatus Riflebacteria bacterium]|nr:diguanylate cyclase [Candidatus Riflebacteria bacterium]
IMETIHLTYMLVGIGLFFSLAASLVLITVLIKEFLAPVSILSNGARAISNGDLELDLPVFAKDELGELSTIFNLMTRRLRNRLTELTVLYNLTQKASTTHSQREIFELAAENLQQHLSAEQAGTVWVGSAESDTELYISDSLEPAEVEEIKKCARTSLKTCRETLETDQTTGKHILCLPLFFEDRKFGAIYLVFAQDRFLSKQGFSDDEKNFMDTLRHHLGLIIENQRLFEEAITDGLTKLYLRRFFLATLDKEISRSKRYQLDLGLLLLDIDNFKKFNDTYGHQAGDYVLRETAQRITENIRAVDTPGRYGGEEIALLLPQTNIKEAFLVAERIRKAIDGSEYTFRNTSMKVNVSIGVTSLHLRNLTMEELIDEADRALYTAKSKGRNQVRIAPEAM